MRATCPTGEELLAFHRGTLSEVEVDGVTDHLESCMSCEAAIRRLDEAADPLLSALRKPVAADSSRTDSASTTRPDLTAPANWPQLPGYVIVGLLGCGGMGVVYKARHLKLNRLVALKRFRSGKELHVARSRIEAESLSRLQHANIVQIYEIVEHGGETYLVLELVGDGHLGALLRGKPQPPRETAAFVETIARAVHHAHTHGVIHRDLKPANILLRSKSEKTKERIADFAPKIADFGVAKWLSGDSGETQEGDVIGTPTYMSPEQVTSKPDAIGPAADVYSLGVILFEMLTGRVPLLGATAFETLLMVRNEEPVSPRRLAPRLDRDLETICLKCLDKDPARRYAGAADLADDLQRYQVGEPIRARPLGRAERLLRWCRRNPVAAGLLFAVSLGSAFGLFELSRLSQHLVRSSALESAAQQSQLLDEVNNMYSADVVERAKLKGVYATHDYATRPGFIPLPATFTIDLGKQFSDRNDSGVQVRLYSDHPFRSRKDGGPKDDFERDALDHYRQEKSAGPYYRFEDVQGRPALRYATAQLMQKACVQCHNSHDDSNKKDWKEGEIAGVLEIIRPLDRDTARAREGLRLTLTLMAVICGSLLGLTVLVLLVGNRRRP
jgi:eukaryotic-like serine/threonine-protein kinase